MSSTVLIKGHLARRFGLSNFSSLYNNQSRLASLNSAIGRGIRRSQGVGFRGKERDTGKFGGGRSSDGPRDRGRENGARDVVRRSSDIRLDLPPSKLSREGWKNSKKDEPPLRPKRETPRSIRRAEMFGDKNEKTRSRQARFYDADSSHGKGSHNKPTSKEPVSWSPISPKRLPHKSHEPERARRAAESDLMAMQRNPAGIKISSSRKAFLEKASGKNEEHTADDKKFISSRSGTTREMQDSRYGVSNAVRRDSYERRSDGPRYEDNQDYSKKERVQFKNNDTHSGQTFVRSGDRSSRGSRDDESSFGRSRGKFSDVRGSRDDENSYDRTRNKFSDARGTRDMQDPSDERSTFRETFDKKMPLSIPYTTPASEFLYGTSVVETALSSRKEPRRKLYKLYIYSGENRDNLARDNSIERLARKAGVEVAHVNADWIRLMDKMSGGRPHNGYILEASPLPKLPVIGLGRVTSEEDMGGHGWENDSPNKNGFSIALDYQSREEAEINGTNTFVQIPRDPTGRKPFVLLLDSILDPGNLGGIIRSASFLGVTAIAISTRNSASFTPVVMKASAGASESVTIFSVNKPAGFLENSKAAGWTIYAAVAPSSHKQPSDPPSTTTDKLVNPLSESPCILMLGNEGEGLRWNLRGKANWDISIPGSARKGAIDSLNVSVAAGILCSAFLRNRHDSSLSTPERDVEAFTRQRKNLF